MAFDLSAGSKNVFDCWLYGHKAVLPASGVEGNCYVVKGSLLEKMMSEESYVDEEEVDDTIDDDDDDDISDADVKYTKVGFGMCRGDKWSRRKWPKFKGFKDEFGCAKACWEKKGCHSFDLSPPDTRDTEAKPGQQRCHLYAMANPQPASGVKGECFTVPKREVIEDVEGRRKKMTERLLMRTWTILY